MTVGTLQYESFASTTNDFSGNGDFIVSASTPKHQVWDCAGTGRQIDLIYVAAAELATADDTTGGGKVGTASQEIGDGVFAGDGVTTSRGELHIDNPGGEDFTMRDGNNGDAALGVIDAGDSAICYWLGSRWLMVGGQKVT
tara:strand:+ start:1442 stop:1864 length:423 start_codon:yes stop_codon:yes gene_type:complete